MATKKGKTLKQVEALKHEDASRKNIPTAEYQSLIEKENAEIREAVYTRNRDLDPQLVWRGKDEQDWSDLVVPAPPLYIQEKVHPKVLIDDLLRRTKAADAEAAPQVNLFADFNGLPSQEAKTEFYQHDQNWSNRMILGDSLQVMASLAEREGLRGKVQCIYFDPPYGIRFNSNFQWSTTTRDVKDGNADHITREPEQVKAFRDTWRDGIHSYLTYIRDRLAVARDLLNRSGSIFVQIGEQNVHLVRTLLDEVFGSTQFCAQIAFKTTSGAGSFAVGTDVLPAVADYVLWYARDIEAVKYRQLYRAKAGDVGTGEYSLIQLEDGTRRRVQPGDLEARKGRLCRIDNLTSQTTRVGQTTVFPVVVDGRTISPATGGWKTNREGMSRLVAAKRVVARPGSLGYVRYIDDFPAVALNAMWEDTVIAGRPGDKLYVVQTSSKVVERCVLMTTDPGDLVLDPTCGSGTAASISEEWGRRWVTIDTSRVALALARARIMGGRYPFYLLADSREGQIKEGEIRGTARSSQGVRNSITHGFVYERVPHVTLKSIANNAEIETISEEWKNLLDPLRDQLNALLRTRWAEEWDVPREADSRWPDEARKLHADWRQATVDRQKRIDASIAAKAEQEYLYDRPYQDPKKVRVAGPFTVESLSPHRVLGVDEHDELIDSIADKKIGIGAKRDFPAMILDNLRTAGVQQANKQDRIAFTALTPWPGKYIGGEGRYVEGSGDTSSERRAGIFIGPEFGTVLRSDLVDAAREAADAGFDVLIACAFNYEAHTTEFTKLGRIPVLKARMNADLHMADDLKNTGKGNLFVIFGEPDIEVLDGDDGQLQVRIKGVDVFHPSTGEVRSDGPDGIACWFIDTDYNEESFFVRHAYFLGQNDPYSALKTTLKAEINEEAWSTLHSDTSRPFPKPANGRIAVKVINHLGDEVMKVFRVSPKALR